MTEIDQNEPIISDITIKYLLNIQNDLQRNIEQNYLAQRSQLQFRKVSVSDALAWKDLNNVPDETYISLFKLLRLEGILPDINTIKQIRKKMNNSYVTVSTDQGCYLNVLSKLKRILSMIVFKLKGRIRNKTFILKFIIDGQNVGRKLFINNFTLLTFK